MKPTDILEKAIDKGMLLSHIKKYEKPGSVILNLSEDSRDILKDLKSDDISDIRVDLIL